MTVSGPVQWKTIEQRACPHCGYCPHCGRGGYGTYPSSPWPYPDWTRPYPIGPVWPGTSITISSDSSSNAPTLNGSTTSAPTPNVTLTSGN